MTSNWKLCDFIFLQFQLHTHKISNVPGIVGVLMQQQLYYMIKQVNKMKRGGMPPLNCYNQIIMFIQSLYQGVVGHI